MKYVLYFYISTSRSLCAVHSMAVFYNSLISCFTGIIIIILGISFMQGIYIYIPETNHVPREHCVAAILM